jgi:hypothetical protein
LYVKCAEFNNEQTKIIAEVIEEQRAISNTRNALNLEREGLIKKITAYETNLNEHEISFKKRLESSEETQLIKDLENTITEKTLALKAEKAAAIDILNNEINNQIKQLENKKSYLQNSKLSGGKTQEEKNAKRISDIDS